MENGVAVFVPTHHGDQLSGRRGGRLRRVQAVQPRQQVSAPPAVGFLTEVSLGEAGQRRFGQPGGMPPVMAVEPCQGLRILVGVQRDALGMLGRKQITCGTS